MSCGEQSTKEGEITIKKMKNSRGRHWNMILYLKEIVIKSQLETVCK